MSVFQSQMVVAQPSTYETVYDFRFRGEQKAQKRGEMIGGNITLRGDFPMSSLSSISDAAMSVMTSLCSREDGEDIDFARAYAETMVQDMTTYVPGSSRVGVVITYWVLALEGGTGECAKAIAFSGTGGTQPPWNMVPPPMFRELLFMELRSSAETVELTQNGKTDDWWVGISMPFCKQDVLIYESVFHPSIPESQRTGRVCGDFTDDNNGEPQGTINPEDVVQLDYNVQACELANTPCMCATLPACKWKQQVGLFRCVESDASAVGCSFCPLQDHCPLNSSAICAAVASPCACTRSSGGCNWNGDTQSCEVAAPGETTSCAICPFQWGCEIPKKTDITPRRAITFPKEVKNHINVTFDRPMRFRFVDDDVQQLRSGAIVFFCRPTSGATAELMEVPMQRLSWTNTDATNDSALPFGKVLQINMSGTVNKYVSDCDLIMSRHAVEDLAGIAYPGLDMGMGGYNFALMDTVPPKIAGFDPRNGAANINITESVTIHFDEPVFLEHSVAKAFIIRLGSVEDNFTDEEADRVISAINLTEGATIEGNQLTINLAGYLDYSTRYSIAVPVGAVRDRYDNTWVEGVAPMLFTFQTGGQQILYIEEEEESSAPFVVGIVAGVLTFSCMTCFGCMMHRLCQRRSKRVHDAVHALEGNHAVQAVRAARQDPKDDDEWDGSFLRSYAIADKKVDAGSNTILVGASRTKSQHQPPSRKSSIGSAASTAVPDSIASKTARDTDPGNHGGSKTTSDSFSSDDSDPSKKVTGVKPSVCVASVSPKNASCEKYVETAVAKRMWKPQR